MDREKGEENSFCRSREKTVTTVTPSPHGAENGDFGGDGKGDGSDGCDSTVTEEVTRPKTEDNNTATKRSPSDAQPISSTREMKTPTAKMPPFEPQYLDLANKYKVRIQSEDLGTEFPDEEDRKHVLYHLGILVQTYGWKTQRLKGGLTTWAPSAKVTE